MLAHADFSATFALIVHNNHARAISAAGTDAQIADAERIAVSWSARREDRRPRFAGVSLVSQP